MTDAEETPRTRAFSPRPGWLDELGRWLHVRPGETLPSAWPMILLPEALRVAEASTTGMRLRHARLDWSEGVPPAGFELAAEPAESFDGVALVEVRATRDGRMLARMEAEFSAGGDAGAPASHGARPAVGPIAERRRSLVVDDYHVRVLCELAGMSDSVNLDAREARRRGYPAPLVPELAILLVVAYEARWGSAGRVDAWFDRAVPSGSVITVWRHDEDDAVVWSVRLPGDDRLAAVFRVTRG